MRRATGWRSIRIRCSRALRALRSCAKGAAAAEFAIIVPVMGVLLTGTVDLAQLANHGLVLDAALRAGASYAMANPTNQTAITNYIKAYAAFPADSVTVTFLNATDTFGPPRYCTCDNGASIACDNSVDPPSDCPSGRKRFYVKIRAVQSGLSPLMQWVGMPTSVTRTLTVRVL